MKKHNLTASKENYIKAIYEIVKAKQAARVKDISKTLDIGPSSVTEALKKLSDEGYVNYEQYGVITLTEEGLSIAKQLEDRNKIICDFLSNLKIFSHKPSSNIFRLLMRITRWWEFLRARTSVKYCLPRK